MPEVRIPLHQNESYWLLDEEMLEVYRSHDARTFSTYPDYVKLREALSLYAGTLVENLIATAGSDAAIRFIAEGLAKEGKRALLPVPSFYGYERIFSTAALSFTTVSHAESDGVFIFPLDTVLSHIVAKDHDALFLCQPNNPLGSLIPREDLSRILDAAKDADLLVIVDEAYFEFAGSTSIERIGSQPIIILRTLSKAFGLAGARVGYAIADSKNILSIQERSLPWPIAHPSVHAALAGLAQVDKLRARIKEVIEARGTFADSLKQLGITVYPSCTNFLLARVPHAERIRDSLRQSGIDVALAEHMSADNDARVLLSSCIRMAIPAPGDSERVLASLAQALDREPASVS